MSELTRGQKTEPAMLHIAAWLIKGTYRTVMHRHNGCWRAIDQSEGKRWDADSLVDLVELMLNPGKPWFPDSDKTAVIMSKQEAMTLPLKDRPICFRISSEMYHAVFEAVGEASMCWEPKPSHEVFDTTKASDVAVRLCFKIADEVETPKTSTAET